MNYQDYLAWSILFVFYLAAVVPFVGSWVGDEFSYYKEDWSIGIVIHGVLCCFAAMLFVVVWAFAKVST
tara:strand:+ start:489 stop:695 length:207 start_codon:yes stop_codon:yes gene_type:complete